MSNETERLRGSGNIFQDLGFANAGIEQMKAELAAKIIHTLNERKLMNLAAAHLSGVDKADISRIRNADLKRFSVWRLNQIYNQIK